MSITTFKYNNLAAKRKGEKVHPGTKKTLLVFNFKGHPTGVDKKYIEESSKTLHDGIHAILHENEETNLQHLFHLVENLYSFDHARAMIDNLEMVIKNYLEEKLKYYLDLDKNDILTNLNEFYMQFRQQMVIIKNIFIFYDTKRFLNNNYCNNKTVTVENLCIELFKNAIILNTQIREKYSYNIFKLISQERTSNAITSSETNPKQNINKFLNLMSDMQVYEDLFLNEFLEISHNFYISESALADSMEICDYLRHIEMRIAEEESFEKVYVKRSTTSLLLDILYKHMIYDKVDKILNEGFKNLLDEENVGCLRLLYRLTEKVIGGTKILSTHFQNYLSNRTTALVTVTDDKTLIQDLMTLKDKMDKIVHTCFKNNDNFHEIIRNCYVKSLNLKQNKSAQLLAKFLDVKLRCKDISEDRLDSVLTKVMVLFRFIHGKDVFEAFYKKDLSKRLLFGRSTSQDAEDSMVGKLKRECGAAFTSKIEGMFKDINISKRINATFRQHLNNSTQLTWCNPEFSINVLTSSFWPTYPIFDVSLPEELANIQSEFHSFYTNNHSGKKLIWQLGLGSCILKADFNNGKKELQVSLFQTLVLLLFNSADQIKYSEIFDQTGMETEELKRTLISLSCGKNRIIFKEPFGKTIGNDDIFAFNQNFSNKLFRIKVNQIQLRESVEEEQATEVSVMADRQFQIDAAIVRILKQKKRITHNELLTELFNVLSIPVKPYDLKKRIEMLIEREYLARDSDNLANYTYIA